MKKYHYLHYLNQYQSTIPSEVEKTFKSLKKYNKINGSKGSKSNNMKNNNNTIRDNESNGGILKRQQIKESRTNDNKQMKRQLQQREEENAIRKNKENINPNILLPNIIIESNKQRKNQKQGLINNQINKKPLIFNEREQQKKMMRNNQMDQLCLNQPMIKQLKTKQFKLSLTKCNFQSSHPCDNLYLVQTQNNELIVCQQCSLKFNNKIPLSHFSYINSSSNSDKIPLTGFNSQQNKISYKNLIMAQQQLQKYNKKLNRIKIIQKQSISQTLNEIQLYYNKVIDVVLQSKKQLQLNIMQIYTKNCDLLESKISQNIQNRDTLNHAISKYEQQCNRNPSALIKQTIFNQSQIKSLLEIIQLAETQNKLVQLQLINLYIPIQLLSNFQNYFKSSQYNIQLQRYPQSNKSTCSSPLLSNQSIQQMPDEQQNQTYQQQIYNHRSHQTLNNKQENLVNCQFVSKSENTQQQNIHKISNSIPTSIDFQKQIPFNIQFSATSQKQHNFSYKIHDQILSKISSSQQLLIESLRNHQQTYTDISNQIASKKIDQFIDDKVNLNFKTQSSTFRTSQPSKQQNRKTMKNFIKNLHVQQNDIDDLICDQDLTLSSSHPIYQSQQLLVQPRKSLRLSHNPLKKQEPRSLTLSQLTSHSTYAMNSNKGTQTMQLLNPSLLSANQNKNQISFQMDQNIIIDANILPCQQTQQQNLDIISPAFKII